MEAEEIEDIEKNLYEDIENKIHWKIIDFDCNCYIEDERTVNNLCKLLEEYKKQQKEIKEASLIMERQLEDICDLKDYISDCISKDKIRDKIKELKIECNKFCELGKILDCNTQCTIGGTIKAFEELLGE